MPIYQEMYKTLFQCATQAIDILKKAQQEAEEIWNRPHRVLWKKLR